MASSGTSTSGVYAVSGESSAAQFSTLVLGACPIVFELIPATLATNSKEQFLAPPKPVPHTDPLARNPPRSTDTQAVFEWKGDTLHMAMWPLGGLRASGVQILSQVLLQPICREFLEVPLINGHLALAL